MVNIYLDVMNQVCPIPAALTRKRVMSMKSGDAITIEGDCAFAVENVIRMIEKHGGKVIDKSVTEEIFKIQAVKK